MIYGVRRPEELKSLGLSQRLIVRVGALLKKSVEITLAVLEAAKPGSPGEAFLLDPALLERAQNLDAKSFLAFAGAHLKSETELTVDTLVLYASGGGVRVICLKEELEAEGAWDVESSALAPSFLRGGGTTAPLALIPKREAGAATFNRYTGSGAEVFTSSPEFDRMRLKLLTAAPAERIEALRILAHAPLSASENLSAPLYRKEQ